MFVAGRASEPLCVTRTLQVSKYLYVTRSARAVWTSSICSQPARA